MSMGQSLLPEFDMEMASTRKVLERLPDDKLDWKCHEKSNTIGWVANHLADILSWVDMTMNQGSFDVHPPGGEPYRSPSLTTRREIVDLFDRNCAAAREVLACADDARFAEPWSLLKSGETLLTMPKGVCIRLWVFNHSIHHRAHLLVYLRLNDAPVPGMYGPSADETGG
jgi:uncharacterized damage-inducible protein DinB